VLNNSTYGNVQVPEESGRGELNVNEASDVHALNNIFVSAKGQNPVKIDTSQPCDCKLGSNLYYGGENLPAGLMGPGDMFADPQYRNVDVKNPWKVDLRVAAKSPAIGSGVAMIGSAIDFAGRARPQSGSDRGAYQK
jgi:hypothetical protein